MTVDQENRAERQRELRLRGEQLVDRVRELIHQGTVRRIVIKNDEGHAVLEIPVTVGVVAAVVAPVLTAIGAIAALAREWTIEVEAREVPGTSTVADEAPADAAGPADATGTPKADTPKAGDAVG